MVCIATCGSKFTQNQSSSCRPAVHPWITGKRTHLTRFQSNFSCFPPYTASPFRTLRKRPGYKRDTRHPYPRNTTISGSAESANLSTPPAASGTFVQKLTTSAKTLLKRLDGLWGKFVPMAALFFCMAFINTILDSLKDSLVITAAGGGTEVIPFLTVYAVFPSSLLFLVAYSYATQRWSRKALFNATVSVFLAFFAAFAVLYPSHESLHLHGLADEMAKVLPVGLSGAVGMVRNWMFTAFYCLSELWGDVVLSLLFWGLANETTAMSDAPLLYPVFGVGANIAQAIAGRSLRFFSSGGAEAYTGQLQTILAVVLVFGVCVIGLHSYISSTFPRTHEGFSRRQSQREWRAKQRLLEAQANGSATYSQDGTNGNGNGKPEVSRVLVRRPSQEGTACAVEPNSSEKRLSPWEAFQFLSRSPQIRCLALMALAQGICTNLVDIAWKNHVRMLHPSPGGYSAFMGDVAMWTGLVTGSLMFASPFLFAALGWKGVASVTPSFLMVTGVPFFGLCIAFNFWFGGGVGNPTAAGLLALKGVVVIGALLQVFGKGAKFSLFKPAEEMVYIGLDEESRSKGKAAVDVVGAQSGKSVGSVVQQILLLASGGCMGSILPVMVIFFMVMLRGWLHSVSVLGTLYDPETHHAEDNEQLPPEILEVTDDDDDDEPAELPRPFTPSIPN